jgi:ribosome-binding factor A
MRMRPVPRIEFLPDTTPEAAQTVETILEKIKNESSGKVEN